MNSGSECEIRETSSNSSQICYIHLCANTFERGMNPSPPPSYGLNDKTFIWNLQKNCLHNIHLQEKNYSYNPEYVSALNNPLKG